MNKDVQAVVLLSLGTAGLTSSLTGTYSAYVKPSLLPYLIASCVVLLVLGAAPYVAELFGKSSPADDHGDDHGHGEHGNRIAWLLVLPTLVLMLIAPPALGASAAEGDSGVVTARDLDFAKLPPIPAGDPVALTLLDVGMRAGFPEVGGLAGRSVSLVGFAEPRADGGWYLTRISIACCAADALALKVDAQGAPAPAKDAWVEVVGTIEATSEGEPPALIVESITPTTEPSSPYLLRGGSGLY
jgi:uncharacterized repeat protein (TIGR03943 family)